MLCRKCVPDWPQKLNRSDAGMCPTGGGELAVLARHPRLRKMEREKKVFVIVIAVQAHTWGFDWAAIMRPMAAALSGSAYNWLMAVGFLLLATGI